VSIFYKKLSFNFFTTHRSDRFLGPAKSAFRFGQGDQIGRIYGRWVIVLLWAITFEITEMANLFRPLFRLLRLCIDFDKKMSWDTILAIFLQTHLVTLVSDDFFGS
jgi:hypothetical protein